MKQICNIFDVVVALNNNLSFHIPETKDIRKVQISFKLPIIVMTI